MDIAEDMNDTPKVPFFCPMCGEETQALLIQGAIYADPWIPVLECGNCEIQWRIDLHDVLQD